MEDCKPDENVDTQLSESEETGDQEVEPLEHAAPTTPTSSGLAAANEQITITKNNDDDDDNDEKSIRHLLALPLELQLQIWEFTVTSDEDALHLNCPCDSTYGGWNAEYWNDVNLWTHGRKHAPRQPALTRVCRSIRADALPLFYKRNTFQAGYCYETDPEPVERWLKAIGEENRRTMGKVVFFDRNERQDWNCPKDVKRVVWRGKCVREFGGRVACSSYSERGVWHQVRFDKEEEEQLTLEAVGGLFGRTD